MSTKSKVEKRVKDIRRNTRRKYSAEEKIRIVLEGLRGEDSIAELCRREGINQNLYYRWSKDFLEAGKKRMMGDTLIEAQTILARWCCEYNHIRPHSSLGYQPPAPDAISLEITLNNQVRQLRINR